MVKILPNLSSKHVMVDFLTRFELKIGQNFTKNYKHIFKHKNVSNLISGLKISKIVKI